MEQTWRWYGPDSPASLADACQAGAAGMVTALHHIPNGEVWSVEEILKRKTIVEDAGLVWPVVESVPVREDIKTRTSSYEQWIANYRQTLHNLAQCGIRTVCYNLMPALDWTRTDLEYVLPDGSKALCFDQIESAAFEMHTLRRPGAEADYTEEEIAQVAARFATMNGEDKVCLTCNIIAGLPGVEEDYTLDQFRKHLELYKDTDKTKLHESFTIFLRAVILVAGEVGVRMAAHPDDPPRPALGLLRIISTIEDMQQMVDVVNSTVNGSTVCAGSHGVRVDNDLIDTVKQFGPHTYFTHLRSTTRENNPKTFHEAVHLNDDVGMYEVMRAIVGEEHRCKAEGKEDLIPMRLGHGHQTLNDLEKETDPDYLAISCLKGLTEVHGVKLTIQRVLFSR